MGGGQKTSIKGSWGGDPGPQGRLRGAQTQCRNGLQMRGGQLGSWIASGARQWGRVAAPRLHNRTDEGLPPGGEQSTGLLEAEPAPTEDAVAA